MCDRAPHPETQQHRSPGESHPVVTAHATQRLASRAAQLAGWGGRDQPSPASLPLLEAVLLPLVEQVRLRRAEVDNLRTAVPVFLLLCALLAVVCVRDPRPAADNAPSLVRPVVALVAYPHECAGPHVGVADGALAVALLTQPADRDPRLLAAHDQIGVVLRHRAPATKGEGYEAGARRGAKADS